MSLPPEAGDINSPVFELNEEWLRGAEPTLQKAAMWRWFATRYEDPELTTPHDTEGNYLYTEGGPYMADEVLHQHFDTLVPTEVVDELVEHVKSEVGNEWAPKQMDKMSS
ncbi:hypothetical protein AAW51_3585 [Caldimonas brevitalea]|uniref:Uncharacterized protein n=1 Tax=Caldimonas brevitalea TaxID=413882 RepID=A0A0G3BSC0_9BURK|nr:hypothetical protein AAW51_3585 [Caldimonas brevitalea]